MESAQNKTVFERNPVKTIIAVILLITLILDVSAQILLIKNRQVNRVLHALNENIAYKLEIHQHRKQNPYYHHDLAPNQDFVEKWGLLHYRMITNSLGFKDAEMRVIQPDSKKKRILFIGDSFTEGFGLPYDKTFVGMIDQRVDHEKYEILNAAVVSYSPKLYYYKTKYLIETRRLKIDELFVFIDISDIFNEIEYQIFEPQEPRSGSIGNLVNQASSFLEQYSFLYSASRYYYNRIQTEKKLSSLDYALKNKKDANFWTLKQELYREWGEKGVDLAQKHMQKLVNLCKAHDIKVTIAVYPYDSEIYYGNRNSKQIRIWKDFAESNGISFINYYPVFFDAPIPGVSKSQVAPYHIINTYFIPGDPHWNELGHRLIADKLPIP